jgi:hypothetical protein
VVVGLTIEYSTGCHGNVGHDFDHSQRAAYGDVAPKELKHVTH